MNRRLVWITSLAFMLASCTSAAGPVPATPTPTPAANRAPGLPADMTACPASIASMPVAAQGFAEPDPETWVMLMKPVREYLYYRKQAVISGDPQILWDRYPAMAFGRDPAHGIDNEAFMIGNFQALKPFDGNIAPEAYDRIRVVLGEDGTAQVLVHGMELYLYVDPAGGFDESGGEFKLVLFLFSRDDQAWTVCKTVDITGP